MMVHLPVMVGEVMGVLGPRQSGIYVDATVGLGGHASEILKLVGPGGRVIGIDRDEEALKMAQERLGDGRVVLRKGRFSDIPDLLTSLGVGEVDGILFDFGVSMMQFKDAERGFSFSSDAPLDMRMDRVQRLTAEEIVSTYPQYLLEKIIREYGEERYASRIAKAITAARTRQQLRTCRELADLVSKAHRGRTRHHPATKVFQALRMAVNDELNEIERGLEASIGCLRRGGRLCTIAYHSLEDRVVKNFLKTAQKEGTMQTLTKKPLTPSFDEIRNNPSARSAKLRGAERL